MVAVDQRIRSEISLTTGSAWSRALEASPAMRCPSLGMIGWCTAVKAWSARIGLWLSRWTPSRRRLADQPISAGPTDRSAVSAEKHFYVPAGRCPQEPPPWTSLCVGKTGKTARWRDVALDGGFSRSAQLPRDTKTICEVPVREHASLTLVTRIRRIPRRWHPFTVCIRNLVPAPQAVHTTGAAAPVDPVLGCPPYGSDTDL